MFIFTTIVIIELQPVEPDHPEVAAAVAAQLAAAGHHPEPGWAPPSSCSWGSPSSTLVTNIMMKSNGDESWSNWVIIHVYQAGSLWDWGIWGTSTLLVSHLDNLRYCIFWLDLWKLGETNLMFASTSQLKENPDLTFSAKHFGSAGRRTHPLFSRPSLDQELYSVWRACPEQQQDYKIQRRF